MSSSIGFKISDFASHLASTGVLQTNKFYVQLQPPLGLVSAALSPGVDLPRLLTLRATQASVPGVVLDTTAVSSYGLGVERVFPTNARFSENGISFVDDRAGSVYKFFYAWMNSIFDFASVGVLTGSRPSYRVSYRKDDSGNALITADLQLTVLDNSANVALQFDMIEAMPIAVHEARLDWSQTNAPLTVFVPFKYTRFVLSNVQALAGFNPPVTTTLRSLETYSGGSTPSTAPSFPTLGPGLG